MVASSGLLHLPTKFANLKRTALWRVVLDRTGF
jgi:hypothetical protein